MGFLAYAVGFGGSMIWFGSSAGLAISNLYPEAKSVGAWLRHGWHVAVAYVVGFFVLLAVLGWNADAAHKHRRTPQAGAELPRLRAEICAQRGRPLVLQLDDSPLMRDFIETQDL